MTTSIRVSRALACAALLAACSSKTTAPIASETSTGSSSAEESPQDSLQITGLRGTLTQEEIRAGLEPRLPKFARCIQQRSDEVEWLSGHMLLEFVVNLDGSVQRVFPRESSLGDRETERCALDIASAVRFARPHGGEAEFTWSFEMPLDDAIREPVPFTAAEAASVMPEVAPAVESSCGAGNFVVTAYLDTAGKVVSAGAATPDAISADKLDCVAQAITAIAFPSPGSYAAKLSFTLP